MDHLTELISEFKIYGQLLTLGTNHKRPSREPNIFLSNNI